MEPNNQIAKLDPKDINMISPEMHVEQNSLFRATLALVRASANPDDGDVYPQEYEGFGDDRKIKSYSPAKPLLMKIATAMAMNIDPKLTRAIDRGATTTPDGRPFPWIEFQAVGSAKNPDGSVRTMSATYRLDTMTMYEDLYAEKLASFKKSRQWATANPAKAKDYERKLVGKTDTDLEQAAKIHADNAIRPIIRHYVRRAESSAINALVRMFANLKSKYTAEELKKPFGVVRIDFQPYLNDPDMKKAVIESARGIMGQLFGNQKQLPESAGEIPVVTTASETAEASDEASRVEAKKNELLTKARSQPENILPAAERTWIEERLTKPITEQELDQILDKLETKILERMQLAEKQKPADDLPDFMK